MRKLIIKRPKNKTKRAKVYAIFALFGCLSWGLAPGAWSLSSSQSLKVSEHKRLEASICPDSMNRITVANDRVMKIFGDEGTFESQHDESTGQVFLKPTVVNGVKDLSLTLVTEQGLTQDLTLKPIAKSATTVILARSSGERESAAAGMRDQGTGIGEIAYQFPFDKTLSIQEQVLNVLKLAIAGQLQETVDSPFPDDSNQTRGKAVSEACNVTSEKSWQAGSYAVEVFQVKNLTETPLEFYEKDFYQPGDLALSFKKTVLPVEGSTTLYVVGRIDQNRELS
jgi:type-F conjugative transfer system secretin TraK